MKEPLFFECDTCKNSTYILHGKKINFICCDRPMKQMVPNTTPATIVEQHIPVVTQNGDTLTVKVGEQEHPMKTILHFIEWIAVKEGDQMTFKYLKPGDEPHAIFTTDGNAETVYEFCNRHGVWKTDL